MVGQAPKHDYKRGEVMEGIPEAREAKRSLAYYPGQSFAWGRPTQVFRRATSPSWVLRLCAVPSIAADVEKMLQYRFVQKAALSPVSGV